MCEAGRVKHHIKNAISNEKNTILITGYCAPKTLGAKLLHGEKKVHIFGEFYDVNAQIESILSLSAHADQSELVKYLSCQDKEKTKIIFLVHGEPESKEVFKKKLEEEGFNSVIVPVKGEVYIL
jgi:metallo-beta-lactamase family protein